jgi:hypothetical protein
MMPFLSAATGKRAAVLSPRRPSDSRSTVKPLAKAMSMHVIVLIPVGMHKIIAGSILSRT